MKPFVAIVQDARLRQLLTYAICGGTGVATDFALYSTIVWAGVFYQLANAAGYAAGTLVSFMLNRHFTFKVYDNTLRRLGLFFATAVVGYLISSLLLWLTVSQFGFNVFVAKLLTLFAVLILQFSVNRTVTFRVVTAPSSK